VASVTIGANDFDALAHPIRREVDPAGVPARFDFLFDHLYPEDPEFGLGGDVGIFRLPAGLFQIGFSFQGDHIFPKLAEHDDFRSAMSTGGYRPNSRRRAGGSLKLLELFMILLTIGIGPQVGTVRSQL